MTQPTLFPIHGQETVAQAEQERKAIEARASVPTTIGTVADEKNRCARYREAILALLREGTATNGELEAAGGNRFGARIHELRKQGYAIEIVVRDKKSGLTLYRLMEEA